MEYTASHVPAILLKYMEDENLFRYFSASELSHIDKDYKYTDPHFGCRGDVSHPPDVADLVFLHQSVRKRKCFTILEFGLGYSTCILADALWKNKVEYEELEIKPQIRCSNMFELHTVDNEEEWIKVCRERVSQHSHLSGIIHFHFSGVSAATFNGRICHVYDSLPDIVPDFIYLDAPGTEFIQGAVSGMTFRNCPDRTVMAADICVLEPTLIPGCFIVVDGRVNNVRFMQNNFQRNWKYQWLKERDVSTFELVEEALGQLNWNSLRYSQLN